ncbi:uncharacterized protein LOC131991449 [Centropristis striata]|uniref:uncharacterized protein LOC131991449 n=1 Tax=Centropristis striata TaxID=184440 RepID=UPI0027E0F8C3|nr:uncharacterized protein LOC131991449 [Centropristis striata]
MQLPPGCTTLNPRAISSLRHLSYQVRVFSVATLTFKVNLNRSINQDHTLFLFYLGFSLFKPCYYPTHIQCWTDWFDRDDPTGSGDWELLSLLRAQNPGKICPNPVDIEARTLSGLTPAAAGDVIYKSDTSTGFICKNQDQKDKKMCSDYRVRFSCHPPFCGLGVCWTKWYDRDDPSGSGDWELLTHLRKENPGQICDNPLYIEATTTDTLTPALSTGDVFHTLNPTEGLVCRMIDQKSGKCRDYRVRFGCPCCD